ncbi:hypothetical protein U1Q18_000192 [Sarracenia purpurea var. burkii]
MVQIRSKASSISCFLLSTIPFPEPAGGFTVLVGDWYKTDHARLKAILDGGHRLPFPDGIQIKDKQNIQMIPNQRENQRDEENRGR